ncbi:MAG TPA: energy transducer TonB [Allosphingosinicella sp.]|nr:energy transducer TonB [Allosphingosinicella sp.]
MAATFFLALLLAAPPLPLSGPQSARPPAPPPAPAPALPPAPAGARAAPSGPPRQTDWPFRAFTPDDYPAAADRAEAQGFVAYRLEIGPDGRVANCTILQSSGSAALDNGTCRIVSGRSRFAPARDSEGRYVPDHRDGWVTWRLGSEEGQD